MVPSVWYFVPCSILTGGLKDSCHGQSPSLQQEAEEAEEAALAVGR